MNWLRKRIVNWLNKSSLTCTADAPLQAVVDNNPNPGDFNLSVMQAMNGKVIQIRSYNPHPGPGSDWRTELYIVAEGEKLTDALAMLMIAKNLEKA